jgi:hypothetical protein
MGNGTRSTLRITDLKRRQPPESRLMNMRIPEHQVEEIARLARQFGASKTEIVVALLNAGLDRWRKVRGRNLG